MIPQEFTEKSVSLTYRCSLWWNKAVNIFPGDASIRTGAWTESNSMSPPYKPFYAALFSSIICVLLEILNVSHYLRPGHLPLTCARSIPFSAASFLASGLANTRPFLGAAGAAAAGAGLGAAAGAAAWNINTNIYKSRHTRTSCCKTEERLNSACC